jgi:rRNA maturation endonuclease Nob1
MTVAVKDVPREQLAKLAEEALRTHPGSKIYFKFTCEKCGERCTLLEPNALYEKGECFVCGHETVISKGGFSLHIVLTPNA